ncbi:MAG: tRNA glutamyl-Q(34) synthetase GluQRS [Phycisphaerales bacterium]|nr:tRNA glutamyl-Q(34) synthetase GluQRS [Phycisphaerales bacterium]
MGKGADKGAMVLRFETTRLAPSPTGALHLGHARTFLVTWWMARQALGGGAKILMRMEDLDIGRAKPESVQQAYEDLQWLGMTWNRKEVVQSQRMAEYEKVLQALWERDIIYPCTCTRADIAESVARAASAPHAEEGNVRYPGTCGRKTRNLKLWGGETRNFLEVAARVREEAGKNVCWRLRVKPVKREFEDVIAGRQGFDVAEEVGDFPLTRFYHPAPPAEPRASGLVPAYQLACVVDDHAMGIDLVVRGDDLLSSTPRQMCLYEAMGWDIPLFAHVPLVVGADGKRLAKRHGESRIAQFREAGVSAERVVGWAAWRCGQLDRPQEISAVEMVKRFDLGKLPRDRVVIGEEDLAWLGH